MMEKDIFGILPPANNLTRVCKPMKKTKQTNQSRNKDKAKTVRSSKKKNRRKK